MFNRFTTPANGHGLYWYSFENGNTHVVQMSSEHDYRPGSRQYAWLAKDLAAVDRGRTPWVIVTAHRPMYCSEEYASDYEVSLGMQVAFEQLLHEHAVDVFLAGHYHSYERTCAVYNQRCVDDGTVHIVVGSAGASLDDVAHTGAPWSARSAYVFGTLWGNATATELTLRFVLNHNGTVADEVVLKARS